MKWLGIIVAVLLGITSLVQAALPKTDSYVPKDGFVPDAATAMRIAEAVWIPIYGADRIAAERPLTATLNGEIWTVTGHHPLDTEGGVAVAEIARKDGRILRVSHGK